MNAWGLSHSSHCETRSTFQTVLASGVHLPGCQSVCYQAPLTIEALFNSPILRPHHTTLQSLRFLPPINANYPLRRLAVCLRRPSQCHRYCPSHLRRAGMPFDPNLRISVQIWSHKTLLCLVHVLLPRTLVLDKTSLVDSTNNKRRFSTR